MASEKTLKERLEQYIQIDGEIADLKKNKQKKISGYFKEDEVYGCLDEFPFAKQKMRVDGYMIPALLQKELHSIDGHIQDLKAEKVYLENLVEQIPNLRTRRIIRQRYIYGEKLADLPSILGYWESYDSIRQVIRNYFKSVPKKPKRPDSV